LTLIEYSWDKRFIIYEDIYSWRVAAVTSKQPRKAVYDELVR
jgi:hypothetical protein